VKSRSGGPASPGHRQDADQDRALHAQGHQCRDDEQAAEGKKEARLGDVSEGDEGCRVIDHEACVLEPDDRQQQADASGGGDLDGAGDGVDEGRTGSR
jgi:hypothetical protein